MADDIPSRIAVLEQIARGHGELASELRSDIREIRGELKTQFRWLLSTILIVLVAQAALWFRLGPLTAEVSQITAMLRQHVGG